jgi:putative transposase
MCACRSRARNEQRFSVVAYCFMPDHVHLLVAGEADDADGRRFVARAKQYAGFHYQRTFGARLWQRYGFEHTLGDEDDTLDVARYILENPLRAGLVRRISDYPYVGSSVYSVDQLLEAVQLPDGWYRRSGGRSG